MNSPPLPQLSFSFLGNSSSAARQHGPAGPAGGSRRFRSAARLAAVDDGLGHLPVRHPDPVRPPGGLGLRATGQARLGEFHRGRGGDAERAVGRRQLRRPGGQTASCRRENLRARHSRRG